MADPGTTVLIVDDQMPFRMAARTVVGVTPGFEVVGEAKSGEEAVEQVDALAPQLVLMDINMPGMGGIAAARQITAEHPEVACRPAVDLRRRRPACRRPDLRGARGTSTRSSSGRTS